MLHLKRRNLVKNSPTYKQFIAAPMLSESANVSEEMIYHVEKGIPLHENIFRMGSTAYMLLLNEARQLLASGKISLCDDDIELLSTDIGQFAEYEGNMVALDLPTINEAEYKGKDVKLGVPKRGGSKKFYVYVKNDKGNVIKVEFGAKDGGGKLAVKLRDPKARASFAKRHKCELKNDKTKPGYWACRLPRYAKHLGLSGGGKWW